MKRLFKQFCFPRRHPQPRRAGNARLDPRRRRTGLLAVARLRRRLRQPRPDRRLRRRRRRGGDRPAGHRAGTPTSSSTRPRDGAVLPILHLNGYKIANPTVLARISHEELEDLFRGYGYTPYFVEGRRPGSDAPAHGRDARHGHRRDQGSDPGRAPAPAVRRAAALADDRPAHAQGLDRPRRDRRQEDRGLLALAPGADGRHGQARARQASSNSG